MGDSLSDRILVKQVLEPESYTTANAPAFSTVDIRGWSKGLLIVNIGSVVDSGAVLTLTLKASAATPASDAISTDTFQWALTCADSDDDEVHMCDMDFKHLTVDDTAYLSFAAATIAEGDTLLLSATLILYEPNGILPASQDNTVKWEIN